MNSVKRSTARAGLKGLFLTILYFPLLANGAVVPDRTRVIFEERSPSASVTISNKNSQLPFVVQSWIEDESGNKITTPFMVLPPLQRIEPKESTVLRLVKLPDVTLPSDRESVFYLNVREIPPKSDAVNSMQIALQSKIKLFYRPTSVKRQRGEDFAMSLNLRIDPVGKQLLVNNPTPFHITVVGLLVGPQQKALPVETVMIAPKSSTRFPLGSETSFNQLRVSNMNDFGGQTDTLFNCTVGTCTAVKP